MSSFALKLKKPLDIMAQHRQELNELASEIKRMEDFLPEEEAR
jgi:hypothetical protein